MQSDISVRTRKFYLISEGICLKSRPPKVHQQFRSTVRELISLQTVSNGAITQGDIDTVKLGPALKML